MKFDGAGSVTLNGARVFFFKKGTSCPVIFRSLRSFAPAACAVLPSIPPPGPLHSSGTRSGTNPSTASAMSVSQEPRRISPSVITSKPNSICLFSASRIARSSAARSGSSGRLPAACAARACSSSGGRSRLPTCSARKGAGMSVISSCSKAGNFVQLREKHRNSIGGQEPRQERTARGRLSGGGKIKGRCGARPGAAMFTKSIHFSREFVEPDVQSRALLGGEFAEHHAHAEAGVGVDDRPGKLAGAAAVANDETNGSIFRKGIDRVDVAAAGAQFRDARAILHDAYDFRFGDKCETRSGTGQGVGRIAHVMYRSGDDEAEDASTHCNRGANMRRGGAEMSAKEPSVL